MSREFRGKWWWKESWLLHWEHGPSRWSLTSFTHSNPVSSLWLENLSKALIVSLTYLKDLNTPMHWLQYKSVAPKDFYEPCLCHCLSLWPQNSSHMPPILCVSITPITAAHSLHIILYLLFLLLGKSSPSFFLQSIPIHPLSPASVLASSKLVALHTHSTYFLGLRLS